MLLCIGQTVAYDFEVDGIYYNKSGSNAEVTYETEDKHTLSYEDNVVIPAMVTYSGVTYSVTSIGNSAFSRCSLRSITIPNSVESIEGNAFSRCSRLTSITIPNSVRSIRAKAFNGCSRLTSVTIPNSVTTIASYVFKDCSGLTSVTIPNSVESIGIEAFYGCSGLTSVIIPEKVQYIGESAFRGCSKLTTVRIKASSPITLYSDAFETKLVKVYVPKGCASIYKSAPYWKDYDIYEYYISLDATSKTMDVGQTLQLSATKSPSSIAVQWNSSNTTVATVSSNGLVTAKKAGTATISAVDQEDSSVKATCTVTVKSGTITLNKTSASVYSGQTLQLSATKTPSDMAVTWNSSNANVATVSSNGLVTAKKAGTATITVANSGDSSVKATCTVTVTSGTITLNETSQRLYVNKTLQLNATTNPSGLPVTWSSSNTTVATVSNTGLVKANKKGVATITVANTSEPSIKASCSITVVYEMNMSETNKVLSVGQTAQLSVKSSLSNPSLEWSSSDTGVATVSSTGLVTAKNIGSAEIKAKLTTDSNSFATCLIDVQDGNVMYVGGIYYNKTGTNTAEVTNRIAGIDCPEAPRTEYSGTINVPASITYSGKTYNVTAIGKRAFYYMPDLQSVVIPNSVKTINEKAFEKSEKLARVIFMESASSALELIGKRAFYGCSRLDGFAMPNRVHTVENEGFRYCTSLSDLTLSTSLNMINEYAFANCTALSTLTLPNSISSVQNYGFAYDSALKDIELPANMQGVGAYCFTDCTALTTVKFNTAISTMTVGSNAFKGCNKLSRVEISRVDSWVQTNFYDQYANPTSIAHHLYKNGSELTSVAIPSGTMYINNNVFSGCSSIKDVTIPSTVQYINDNIFLNCTSMNKVICNATNVPPFIGTDDPTKMNAVFNKASLYVPATSVSKYKGDSWWKRFHYIGSLDEITHTITKIEEVNANKCYIIFTDERGGLTVKGQNDTRIWGTSEEDVNQEVNMGDVFQHFAFVKQGDKLYLYNVATKKYVSDDLRGALTDQPSAPITFADASDGTVRLVFDASHNINLGGSKQVLIDNWTYKDAGNSFHIMEAGDFSGVVAAISPIATGNTMTPEFDLQGRMVKNWPYQRGVSIVNGRKIIR